MLGTKGSSEEAGLLKVTVMMSLTFEQDVLINPWKQPYLETNHIALGLFPPSAFSLSLAATFIDDSVLEILL